MTTPTFYKHPLSIFTFLLLPFLGFTQKETKECTVKIVDDIRCVYNLENGLINGAYTSFYTNGKKRVEGQFQKNERIGTWTIWDSTGEILHQRKYDNAFTFKVLKQKINSGDSLYSQTKLNLKPNADGYIELPLVKQTDIIHSQRYWRMVDNKKQNPALLADNSFFDWLTKNILDNKINAYTANSNKFWYKMTADDLKNKMDSLDVEIVGYRIKEERFFSIRRQCSQTNILGLAPIVRSKKDYSKEEFPLFWVRMPEIRKED